MTRFVKSCVRAVEFGAFYLVEVIASNLRVAWEVLTPPHTMRPGMITIDVSGLSDRQLVAVANLLTMTPGTLSVDLDEAGERLLVHALYVDDPEADAAKIEASYIRRIRNVF